MYGNVISQHSNNVITSTVQGLCKLYSVKETYKVGKVSAVILVIDSNLHIMSAFSM